MHSALHYSGQTDLQKSGGDVLYRSFEGIRAWKRGNSNHQKFLSTRYDEKQDTNHRNQQFRTKFVQYPDANSPNHLAHVGTVVDVLWTEEELDGTNWKPGWYRGEVQQYDEDDNLLYILYFKDRAVFSLNATGAFSDGIIRAVS